MWKRLILFLVIVFMLMFVISGIHSEKKVVPATAGEEIANLDPKSAHTQGVAVNVKGDILQNTRGEVIHWDHPNKYFCEEGYLRSSSNDDKILTQQRKPVHKSELYAKPESSLIEQILHRIIFPN